jgi:soluble lytic murein transglycosylase-like protein
VLLAAVIASLLVAPAEARDVYVYRAANGTLVVTDSPHHDEFDLWWKETVAGMTLPNGVPMPRLDRITNLHAYDGLFREAAGVNGIPAELLKAVAVAESRMNPRALSHAGAMGLMQLMPATARSLGVRDAYTPEQAVPAGARLLAELVGQFGSFELGLAAYNAGPGAVQRARGIPRNVETPTYVARVMGLYQHFRDRAPVSR